MEDLKMENYTGSFEVNVKKVQVFSCSNLAVPYYLVEYSDGGEYWVGGVRLNRLDDIKDIDMAVRNFDVLLYSLLAGSDGYEHTCKCHRMVDELYINGRVLIDMYDVNGETKFALGGSSTFYLKDKDGKIVFWIDAVEANNMIKTA